MFCSPFGTHTQYFDHTSIREPLLRFENRLLVDSLSSIWFNFEEYLNLIDRTVLVRVLHNARD